jgi:DNA polymerase elongation subunit (family B)
MKFQRQTGLHEGDYFEFKTNYCIYKRFVLIESMDQLIQIQNPRKAIEPVYLAFDIEVISMSSGFPLACNSGDRIISISLCTKNRVCNGVPSDVNICLYLKENDSDVIDLSKPENVDGFDDDIYLVFFTSELQLIETFCKYIECINPDVITGFNSNSFDWVYINDRYKKLMKREMKTNVKSLQLKRYDVSSYINHSPAIFFKSYHKIYSGFYQHFDLYIWFRIRFPTLDSFSLDSLCQHFLNETKYDLDFNRMRSNWTSLKGYEIVIYNVRDSLLVLKLLQKTDATELAFTYCKLYGTEFSKYASPITNNLSSLIFKFGLNNSRVDAITNSTVPDPIIFDNDDMMKLHEFRSLVDRNPIIDLKYLTKACTYVCSDTTPLKLGGYSGAYVFKPHPGLYENVLIVDYNSLYPSIMIDENICPTMLAIANDGNVYRENHPDALLPKLQKQLLQLRVDVRAKMKSLNKNSFEYSMYNNQQLAYKLAGNSLYGYLGVFLKPLANLITLKGQEKLKDAETFFNASEVEGCKFKVIYGDTDSCFLQVITTNAITEKDLIRIGDVVTAALNDKWKGYKISCDSVVKRLLLLKKKRYCYYNFNNETSFVGWLVKRDYPKILRQIFRKFIQQLIFDELLAVDNLISNLEELHGNLEIRDRGTCDALSMSMELKINKVYKGNLPFAHICYNQLKNAKLSTLPGDGDRCKYLMIRKGNDRPLKVSDHVKALELLTSTDEIDYYYYYQLVVRFFEEIHSYLDKSITSKMFDELCKLQKLYWNPAERTVYMLIDTFKIVKTNRKRKTLTPTNKSTPEKKITDYFSYL